MTRSIFAAALVGLIALPAFASPDSDLPLGAKRKAEVTALLTQQGYDVRRVDAEDGMIEVYALKDGQRLEIYLDAELNIVRIKSDD